MGKQSAFHLVVAATLAFSVVGCPKSVSITENTLKDSEWQLRCPPCNSTDLQDYRVQLRDDGTLAYKYPSHSEWQHDGGDDLWRIEGTDLILEWSNGFSIETFPIGERKEDWAGTKSNVEGTVYARLLD